MKFKEYLASLNAIAEKRPESLDYIVIYAIDDEGNGFQRVNCDGLIGHYDGEYRGEFEDEKDTTDPLNAVCIN